jgi:hypothetical protein
MAAAPDPGRLSFVAESREGQAMDVTGCPEPGCSLPAEILDRMVLESTDGPIEHARTLCLSGHRFLMPTSLGGAGHQDHVEHRLRKRAHATASVHPIGAAFRRRHQPQVNHPENPVDHREVGRVPLC